MKTTFTAEELEATLNEVQKISENFPDLPVKLNYQDDYSFWSEDTFPLALKKVGNDQDVTIHCHDYFDGEEGGDHNMRCVMKVGYGEDLRYFLKTGLYDSWDSSEWDGPIMEVQPETIEVIKWVTRAGREQGNQN